MTINTSNQKVVVVGGGIVGICCALYLQKSGFKVTIVDPLEVGESTAKWSCGQMAISEIIPLSKKGILKQVPKWLLDTEGPLSLRLSAFPNILPWFLQFINCSRNQKINEISCALASLTKDVYDDYSVLLQDCSDKQLIGSKPVIELFDHAHDIENERQYFEIREDHGFKHEVLDEKAISDLEPVFSGKFKHGVLFNDWTAVKDTKGFMVSLNDSFIEKGGERIRANVVQLRESNGQLSEVLLDNQQTLKLDYAVISAGVGSRHFSKQLGISPPLAAITGYQIVLPESNVEINHSTIYASGGFCFSPMSRGLQIGGTIEFASHDSKPNMQRADIILKKAKKILPQLNTNQIEYGVGYRPFLPDTKPIIDLSPNFSNVALAFGHGQLGLTLGATTGRLVADLLCKNPTKINLSPFSATRF